MRYVQVIFSLVSVMDFLLQSLISKLSRVIRKSVMRIRRIVYNTSKVQVARIARVYFEHPELDAFVDFAADWGQRELNTQDMVWRLWRRSVCTCRYRWHSES